MSAPDLLFTASSSHFAKKRPPRRRTVVALLIVLAVLVIGAGAWFARSTMTAPIVGQLAFASSGQPLKGGLNVADQVQIDLHITQGPTVGKSYFAWLLPDQTTGQAVLLGAISPHGQAAHLTYNDPQHSNLLADNSRLLITEQATTPMPRLPSSDRSDWRYLAQIPQTLSSGPGQQYSLLDHLRHLLAARIGRTDHRSNQPYQCLARKGSPGHQATAGHDRPTVATACYKGTTKRYDGTRNARIQRTGERSAVGISSHSAAGDGGYHRRLSA